MGGKRRTTLRPATARNRTVQPARAAVRYAYPLGYMRQGACSVLTHCGGLRRNMSISFTLRFMRAHTRWLALSGDVLHAGTLPGSSQHPKPETELEGG